VCKCWSPIYGEQHARERVCYSSTKSRGVTLTTLSKRNVVFSTKANGSTRENIANVFGAKTLQALVPLDLKFELNPSTLPSQTAKNWSTQTDYTSKAVQLVGHISRPVVGEGRQTADRQMFFVNSRPCLLPQVAKAINEVYRSYNLTQSPFIFANLKLDTNAYDVNVSPDKRTILLHDQTVLLEALKNSLTDLFESHEQSVPQAQASVRKLPVYKALPITRQSPSKADEDELDDDSSPGFSTPPASIVRKFVARHTITRDEAEKRSNRESINRQLQSVESHSKEDEPSKDKELAESTPLPTALAAISTPVKDFNRRLGVKLGSLASIEDDSPRSGEGDTMSLEHNSKEEGSIDPEEQESGEISPQTNAPQSSAGSEQPIPSISRNTKILDDGILPSAFERMRRPRFSEDTATITIGDVTTVTTLGSPSKKRQRTDISKQKQRDVVTSTDPVLLKSLRSFAAPGSHLHDVQMDDVDMVTLQSEQENGPSDETVVPRLRNFPSSMTIPSSDLIATRKDVELNPSEEEAAEDALVDDSASDGEYVDEVEKKAKEELKVARMIAKAEEAAARPTEENIKRATSLLKARSHRDATLQLLKNVDASTSAITDTIALLQDQLRRMDDYNHRTNSPSQKPHDDDSVEERLALSVSKADFGRMKVLGQFNLGFILSMRPSHSTTGPSEAIGNDRDYDELFIIDQHASDEKYNFERLQAETVVQNQRLVHPKTLDLTAIEEELILNHPEALSKNGFIVSTDQSGDKPVGRRCQLISLPMSKEVVFDSQDLEELLALLSDQAGSAVPRPSKVRRMFAMRACRSSIMVGKTLTTKQMQKVVSHMGEIDKPWNCPHGRPTMRHLYGLGAWNSWHEGSGVAGLGETLASNTDWNEYLRQSQAERDAATESEGFEDHEE
jgi:DNA mismatch repair protein PMS2